MKQPCLSPPVALGCRMLVFILAFAIVGRPAGAQLALDVPGYRVLSVTLSESEPEGPALAAHPAAPVLFATLGGYGPHTIVRADLATSPPAILLFSAGAYRSGASDGLPGDNLLDSRFGAIGGMAVLPDGSLLVTDNSTDPTGHGDTIYIARDLNGDGDALDVVLVEGQPTSETRLLVQPPPEYTPPGSGWGGFSGAQAEIGPDGTAYIVTADGGGQGEVLAIETPLTTPTIRLYYPGLEYGSGLAFDSAGRLYVGNADYWGGVYSIHRLSDLNDNGHAMDPGESELLTSDTLTGLYDMAMSDTDQLFLTANNQIQVFDPATRDVTLFAHDANPFAFFQDLTFVRPDLGFAPFSGPDRAMLVIADMNFDGRLVVLTPGPGARVVDWELLQ